MKRQCVRLYSLPRFSELQAHSQQLLSMRLLTIYGNLGAFRYANECPCTGKAINNV